MLKGACQAWLLIGNPVDLAQLFNRDQRRSQLVTPDTETRLEGSRLMRGIEHLI